MAETAELDATYTKAVVELSASLTKLGRELENSGSRKQAVAEYYRLFHTELLTRYIKCAADLEFQHPQELFRGMEVPFLDHYMAALCRTVGQVAMTPLKPYGELIPGKEGKPPLPLPYEVYVDFLAKYRSKEVTASNDCPTPSYQSHLNEKQLNSRELFAPWVK